MVLHLILPPDLIFCSASGYDFFPLIRPHTRLRSSRERKFAIKAFTERRLNFQDRVFYLYEKWLQKSYRGIGSSPTKLPTFPMSVHRIVQCVKYT